MITTKTFDTSEKLFAPLQRTVPANPFPRKHLHCVFDTWEDAARGYHTLEEAGYNVKDIHILTGKDYMGAIERKQSLISFLTSGDIDIYRQEAQRGHHILVVHAAGYEQMKQLRSLLLRHHARLMKYIDTWTTVDLIP